MIRWLRARRARREYERWLASLPLSERVRVTVAAAGDELRRLFGSSL